MGRGWAAMSESSDRALLDLLRRRGPMTVAEMAAQLGVTATAVRNRLSRLLDSDLAVALWEEMMTTVEDRKLRRLLFTRITERLAEVYRGQVSGPEWEGRLVQ